MTSQLGRTSVVGMLLFIGLVLASPAQDSTQDPKDVKKAPLPNYLPLQVGNEWRYRAIGGGVERVTMRVANVETIDGVAMARLESVAGENTVVTEHLGQTEKGIFRHRYNGLEVAPPYPLLQYPIKATEEAIEVPAGKFKAIRVDGQVEAMGKTIRLSAWFAKSERMSIAWSVWWTARTRLNSRSMRCAICNSRRLMSASRAGSMRSSY